jgi:hypothetical protein
MRLLVLTNTDVKNNTINFWINPAHVVSISELREGYEGYKVKSNVHMSNGKTYTDSRTPPDLQKAFESLET